MNRPALSVVHSRVVASSAPLYLQVSGNRSFEESRWRECFLYYLNGVWSGDQRVMYRPKISFGGGLELRLDADSEEYYATSSTEARELPGSTRGTPLVVGRTQAEVDQALVRFVKDDRLQFVVIVLGEGQLFLWKLPQRSRLGIATKGVPNALERLARCDVSRTRK